MIFSKKFILPLSAAAAMAIAGCGGGNSPSTTLPPVSTAAIGGTVSGLPTGATLLLVNNGLNTISVDENGGFSFDRKVQAGSAYNVTLFTQPTGAACAIENGAGNVDADAHSVTNVSVKCAVGMTALLNYNIGVTVSGLAPNGTVIFLNNRGDSLSANADGLFVFPKTYSLEEVPAGGGAPGAYSVSVSSNPAGQTCTLANPSGVVGSPKFSNFINVSATCR